MQKRRPKNKPVDSIFLDWFHYQNRPSAAPIDSDKFSEKSLQWEKYKKAWKMVVVQLCKKSTLKTPINIPSFKGVVKTTKRAVIIMPKPPPTFLFAWCKLRMIMKRKVGLCVLRSVKYAFSNSCESCKQTKFWDFFRQLKCNKPLSKIFE